MSNGRSRIEVRTPPDIVASIVSDLRSWSEWMPGVAAVTIDDDDSGSWRVDSPMGPVEVPLRFEVGRQAVRFAMPPGTTAGPFTKLQGLVAVEADAAATFVTVEMELDGTPTPPPPMAQMIADGATGGLNRQLINHRPPAPESKLVHVEMSDGVRLAVHHYEAPASPAPVVLLMIPYRKEGAFVPELARIVTSEGYHFCVADVRGFGGSVAPYEGLLSDREVQDYVEFVEWAADQHFGDGQVATMGASYCGANQLLVAARRPKGLRCIAASVAPADTYRDWTHRGGIPTHTLWGAMTYLSAQQSATMKAGLSQYYLELQTDRLDNDGHHARSPEYVLDRVEVPAMLTGGWHDYFLRPTVREFLAVAGPKRLVIGPWGHGDFSPRQQQELVAWLDYWLRAKGDDPTAGERVQLFVTGAEHWVSRDDWPDTRSVPWHEFRPVADATPIQARTHLMAVPPAPNPKRQFLPDPTDSGFGLWGEDHVFDSEPFRSEVRVEGPVALFARLSVDGECTDVDVHARLSVVAADGPVVQLTEGRLRASHRAVDPDRSLLDSDGQTVVPWHPHDREDPLEPGVPVDLVIEVYPIAHRFAAGDRLRLGLTLTRADEGAEPVAATVYEETRVVLALAP